MDELNASELSTRCGSTAHLVLGTAWHSHAGARTVLTISMFTQIIYLESFWIYDLLSQNFCFYVVIHGYGVRWIAVEISGCSFHAFLGFWDFRAVACLPFMAHRTFQPVPVDYRY